MTASQKNAGTAGDGKTGTAGDGKTGTDGAGSTGASGGTGGATGTTEAKATKTKYQVISPLDLNNERFEPGQYVTLTDKEAEPLLGHTVKKPEKN